MNLQDFYNGQCFDACTFLGAHVLGKGVVFRTYAPAASKVSLIGEFSDWFEIEMSRIENGQFYEVYVEHASIYQMYKFRIYHNGSFTDHSDPYAYYSELRPQTASIIYSLDHYDFHDDEWMNQRHDYKDQAFNIYELNMGSWRKRGSEITAWYNYRDVAHLLIPYLKDHHYQFVELMPITEYPNDSSWGYQSTGYFAPTSRYGTPDDLRYFIDLCHQNHIGVLLDFVPVHFAIDGFGLNNYDGTPLYNYPNEEVGMSEWGTCNFQHSRGDVCSFLNSSAYYWLKEYHFDGLRLDAVGNLIYWQGDIQKGENREAIRFLKNFTSGLKSRIPHAILCAEDSSAYKGVTTPVNEGGLGFDFKWDLGWMNDTLSYFQLDPKDRTEHYHKLTFSMMYFYDEAFILPLSHDEVVHGKKTIIDKMYGNYQDKFQQYKAFYMYMYAHPGKKLNFMGNEFGQFREWDENREQDWFILEYPTHQDIQKFMIELHHIYVTHDAFYSQDYQREGYEWIDCNLEDQCLYSFKRIGSETILCLFNFSHQRQIYKYHTDQEHLIELFSTENKKGHTEYYVHEEENIILEPYSAYYYKVE